MKSHIQLIILVLLFPAILNAQQEARKSISNEPVIDSVTSSGISKNMHPDKKHTLPEDFTIRTLSDKFLKSGKIKDSLDLIYPGASKYYARRPYLIAKNDPFVIKPDTINKYYLIVKNPLKDLKNQK